MNNIQLVDRVNTILRGFSQSGQQQQKSKTSLIHNKEVLKTNNELVAQQMLENFEWVSKETTHINSNGENDHESFESLERLINLIKLKRTTTHSRLYQALSSDMLLNVCNRCNGPVKII
jgi:hypothetical protein